MIYPLIGTWASFSAVFYLASLGVGVLCRRGIIPLHLSALVGTGAYVFAAFCGMSGIPPTAAAMIALLATVAVSAISGLVFLRLRGPAAALATISMYFLFDKYISTCSWTGGASGIWQGVPHLSVTEQIAITLLAITCCATLYALFQRTNSSALVIAHGNSPLFAIAAAPMSPIVPLLVANCLVGFCAGCAGLVLTLQIGFIAPSTFSLNSGLLYAGTILLVGWRSLLPIAVGAIVFSFIPNVLRLCGLGESQSSAWQGVLVGAGVAALVWAQFPRMASSKTLRSCGQSIPATGYAKAINHPEP